MNQLLEWDGHCRVHFTFHPMSVLQKGEMKTEMYSRAVARNDFTQLSIHWELMRKMASAHFSGYFNTIIR